MVARPLGYMGKLVCLPLWKGELSFICAVKLCPLHWDKAFYIVTGMSNKGYSELIFIGGDKVEEKFRFGDFLVSFRRSEVTGVHNEKEVELIEICNRLGRPECKVFDPFVAYSRLAECNLLERVKIKNLDGSWTVFFFYPIDLKQSEVRRQIINGILYEASKDNRLFLNRMAVVISNDGRLKLACIKQSHKNYPKRKRNRLS